MTFCYTFTLASYTLHKPKHSIKSHGKQDTIKDKKLTNQTQSHCEHTVEMKPFSVLGQLSGLTADYIQALEDVSFVWRWSGQSLG